MDTGNDMDVIGQRTTALEQNSAAGGMETTSAEPVSFRAWDCRNVSLLNSAELRKLRLRHEEFARSLATRLSIYLRADVEIQVKQLETGTHERLVQNLPAATHATLFRIEGLSGSGAVEMSPLLAMALAERMLGGAGVPAALSRELTEIEVEVVDYAVQLFLKEWCSGVPRVRDVRSEIVGHEANCKFLQTAPAETAMLLLTMEIRLGGGAETFRIFCPFEMVETAIRQSAPAEAAAKPAMPASIPSALKWNPVLNDVKIPITAGWHGLEFKALQIAQLQIGDVLPLAVDQFEQVQVSLAKVQKFSGRLGKCNDCWAIELTQNK